MASTEPRDPRDFTPSEVKTIQLAIGSLQEFTAGYLHIERLRQDGLARHAPALDRFLETGLTTILDGFYPPDRTQGLIPVLRLVNCIRADDIEAALNRRVGTSTYQTIQRIYRNRGIVHLSFSAKTMMPIVESVDLHLQKQEDINAFGESSYSVKRVTAELFLWFQIEYPELTAYAIKPHDPPEMPPSPDS